VSERSPESIAFVDVILQALKSYIVATEETEIAAARQQLIEIFVPTPAEEAQL
jgi:hypothetical protein